MKSMVFIVFYRLFCMGQVALTLRVMPEGPDVDMEKIKMAIRRLVEKNAFRYAKLQELKEVPIAFGLKAIEILIVLPDTAGGTDSIERAISEISGVASVEAGDVTLL